MYLVGTFTYMLQISQNQIIDKIIASWGYHIHNFTYTYPIGSFVLLIGSLTVTR